MTLTDPKQTPGKAGPAIRLSLTIAQRHKAFAIRDKPRSISAKACVSYQSLSPYGHEGTFNLPVVWFNLHFETVRNEAQAVPELSKPSVLEIR